MGTVGLYRSTNSGASFDNLVIGLPAGNIQNLVSDPSDPSRFYLSVVNGDDSTAGIYTSDNSGANWKKIQAVSGLKITETEKADGRILLSVGTDGVLVAQVQQAKTRLNILRTADQGNSWTLLAIPSTPYPGFTGLFPSGQTEVHGAVLVDPSNSNIIYVAGDTQYSPTDNLPPPNSIGAQQWSCPIFRGVYDPATQQIAWTYITNNNTLSGSAPHADARTFAIDANGRLLFGGDGGLNAYPYPATIKTSDWIPIMDNLRITEMTQSCWNSVTHTVSAAAQDVGAYYQFPGQKGTYDWSSTRGGDGGPGPVNVETFKSSAISVVYASGQYLGSFKRFEVGKTDDAQKAALTMTTVQPYWQNGATTVWLAGNETYMSFLPVVALNRADPRKMAIGGARLFAGTDDPSQKSAVPGTYYQFQVFSMLPGTGVLPNQYQITSLAYGTNSVGLHVNANALLAGAGNTWKPADPGYLYYTSNADTIDMTTLGAYTIAGGKHVWQAIFDERDGDRFYVADGANVWRSTDAGGAFASINGVGAGKLPDSFVDRRGLAFAASNGVNALFVGGVSDTANGSGLYVTRYTSAPGADSATPTWSSFGGSLANAPVFGMSYDTTDDVLLVNLFGRGAWVVYDLTSYFPEATTLIFGKANNSSTPAISLLTDGTPVDGGATFSRGLTKTGTGTLTINGAIAYTGLTDVQAGTLAYGANDVIKATNSVKVSGGTLDIKTFNNTVAGVQLTAGSINGTTGVLTSTSAFDLQAGAISAILGGNAGLTKTGPGTVLLTGANTYTGPTAVTTGTLQVRNGQALGTGAGNVINSATLDIGLTKLNIGAGNYTQNVGATLQAAINGTSSGRLSTTGNCTLASGDSLVLSVTNFIPTNTSYTIIDGAGAGGIATPVITTPDYDNALFTATTIGEDLVLTATRGAANGFAADAAGNANASAAGAALDNITDPSGDMQTVLDALDGLSDAEVVSSLATMVPEVDAGVIDTSTASLNNFVGVAMDRVENVLTIAKAPDSARTGISAGDESKLNGIWGKGYGSYLTQGTRNNIAGYDAWNAGTALGIDHVFADCFVLGASGGYAYGNVDGDVNNANTGINSAQTTIYGGYADQNLPFFIDAAGSFAYNWYDGTRDIQVGPAISRRADAVYGGQQYGAYVGGGYIFALSKNIEFTPLISLQWNHLRLNSYTETGAGALDLNVARQSYDQLLSGVGARVASPMRFHWGTFTPEAHGKWFYDFIGDPFAVSSNFNGGGASFGSSGCKPALNSFNAGGQLIFDFRNDVSIVGTCDAEIKDRFVGVYGSLTLRYDF